MATAKSYWSQSAQPLQSLVFVLPMLVAYEVGILLLGRDAIHNGAAEWLRRLLSAVGFGQYVLLPVLTVAAMLAWHHLLHKPWKISWPALAGMLLEACLWGFALLLFFRVQAQAFALFGGLPLLSVKQTTASIIGFFGAGIYEELLFRVMLLPAIYYAMRAIKAEQRMSVITAVVLSSLMFAAAHYAVFVGAGDPFQWRSFLFRFSAGAFFAVLLVTRGFGVTAGAHAAYDVVAFVNVF